MREVFNRLPAGLNIPGAGRSPSQALASVTSKSGLGVYASSDRLFKGAVFGRDSLEVADDLMHIKPKLVKKILLTISSLAGETDNDLNEEEPGKIIHEYRLPTLEGKPLNDISNEIYERLSSIWGGDEEHLAYYGSVDATPHYIKTLTNYCQEYGMEILNEQIKLRSGRVESVLWVFEGAIDWLARHLDASQSGFVEYQRRNPRGIENQVWKDSREFYVHTSGELANHSRPISSIEVQSLAFDALRLASDILPSRKKGMEERAVKLGRLVFEKLWMADKDYFALGTDFSNSGDLRPIKTMTANPAEMLDSQIFNILSDEERKVYVSGIIREIMGTAFLTDAGVRSRALSEANLVKFWDYHGSFVTWPKETYGIAKGMRYQGFSTLAIELENRLLNVVKAAQSYPEFFYVDERGRILGVPTKSRYHGDVIAIDSPNRPERVQAWTVAAIISILSRHGRREESDSSISRESWRAQLEKEVLRHIPHVPRLRSSKELSARYPAYPYELDKD